MRKIGLLGCGNIGSIISQDDAGLDIVAFFDKTTDRAKHLADKRLCGAHEKFDSFLNDDHELIVEAASIEAVSAYGEAILDSGRDLVVLSVGAFADLNFKQHLESVARSSQRNIYIPSGAIFGLDNIKIAQISPITKLLLKTTKHPQSLGLKVTKPTLAFSGKAKDSIKLFPKNINVAVSISLAAGMEARVEIWADPCAQENTHEILLEGAFGKTVIKTQNLPSPDNPATSYLAALSIITLLKNLDNPFRIGT